MTWTGWVSGLSFPWPWEQHFLSCGSATILVNIRGWYCLPSPSSLWVWDSEPDFARFCPNSKMCLCPWNMQLVTCSYFLWPRPSQAPGHAKGTKPRCVWDMPLCTLTASLGDMYSSSFNDETELRDMKQPQSEVTDPPPKLWTRKSTHWPTQCVKVKSLSRVRLVATPWSAAY